MPSSDTQFKPGQSGNPGGRKPGFSITAMVRRELDKVEPKTQKKWGELVVRRIFLKATSDGDVQMLKAIWAYMDGMPSQPVEHKGTIEHDVQVSEKDLKEMAGILKDGKDDQIAYLEKKLNEKSNK